MRTKLRTVREWNNLGYTVYRGERARYENAYGEALFSRGQVRRRYL